jgi:hypothetical protein
MNGIMFFIGAILVTASFIPVAYHFGYERGRIYQIMAMNAAANKETYDTSTVTTES